ncbi:MAG TPA: flavodoxin family protein [Thermoanaerobaculia bacterium]|nr:flavodoxin family protein [Thermoanaerobaculia bacterium]
MRVPALVVAILLTVSGPGVRAEEVPARILIAYYSASGHTRTMAEAVARGARSVEGAVVTLRSVGEVKNAELLAADAIIVGSPVYNAAPAPAVQQFINGWPFEKEPLKDKIGAAFVTAGGISAGEELVQLSLLHSMLVFGMIVVGGPGWSAAFGASAVVDEPPFGDSEKPGRVDPQFLRKGEELGARVATLAVRMRR